MSASVIYLGSDLTAIQYPADWYLCNYSIEWRLRQYRDIFHSGYDVEADDAAYGQNDWRV